MRLTKFEHASFVLSSEEAAIAVDMGAYVSESSWAQLPSIQATLVSHIHGDHFSEPNLQRMNVPVYTVAQVAQAVTDQNIQLETHAEGEEVTITGTPFTVTFTPSDHGPYATQPLENVGFLIEAEGKTLYFLGDMYNGAAPLDKPFDVLLIPVGNNNYTFGPQEAADYVQSLGWNGLTIPVHYDGQLDPATAQQFKDLASSFCKVQILATSESLDF